MEVSVNQQIYCVPDNCNVQDLLSEVLKQSSQGLALAVNDTIIPRSLWEIHDLCSGDQIIIIKATQGG